MCLSGFVFVQRGRELLLGKYTDDPRWEHLTGLDASRRRQHGQCWTLPATHLKFGEDPRLAARRVVEEAGASEGLGPARAPRADDLYKRADRGGMHVDVWFLVDAEAPARLQPKVPPWFAALEWRDPRKMSVEEWGRAHEDVFAHWNAMR